MDEYMNGINAAIDTLRLIRVRVEDVPQDGNRLIEVINSLIDIRDKMKEDMQHGRTAD